MSNALHVKYRPKTFDEVVGQKEAVASLEKMVERGRQQAFVLTGPSGCGKTTLARIAADALNCRNAGILEIDAATNTGVDAMREVQKISNYKPFGKEAGRAIIIDEAHRLSGQAWDSMLKAIEEPPEKVYWFFCTTNPAKVPTTIKTRCAVIQLKLVNDNTLTKLVEEVCDEEEIEISEGVLQLVVREAMGSPRQALVNLEACDGITSSKEAAKILRTALESDATLELCRLLVQGGSWVKAMALVAKLDGENPEGVRIVVCNYLGSVLKGTKNDNQAGKLLHILDQFSQPYNSAENTAPLLLSIGRAMFAG